MCLQFLALGTITMQGSHNGRFLKWLELMVSTQETTATLLMNNHSAIHYQNLMKNFENDSVIKYFLIQTVTIHNVWRAIMPKHPKT